MTRWSAGRSAETDSSDRKAASQDALRRSGFGRVKASETLRQNLSPPIRSAKPRNLSCEGRSWTCIPSRELSTARTPCRAGESPLVSFCGPKEGSFSHLGPAETDLVHGRRWPVLIATEAVGLQGLPDLIAKSAGGTGCMSRVSIPPRSRPCEHRQAYCSDMTPAPSV